MAREGGSYQRDPKTGKARLVERTQVADEKDASVKTNPKKPAKGGKE